MQTIRKPVHILTGFLGAGKTTLLNKLLKRPEFARTLIIVNEFGAVSLDHLLYETSQETIFELENGCLCCSIRSELVDTLLSLDTALFDRVVIETTGIADPLPILQSLSLHEIVQKGYQAGSIITVFPAHRGGQTVSRHSEAQRQLALADQIYIPDPLAGHGQEEAFQLVRNCNPLADIFLDADRIDPDRIFSRTFEPNELSGGPHSGNYQSLLLRSGAALSLNELVGFQHLLASNCAETVLRLKGIAFAKDAGKPVLLQMSGTVVHDPVAFETQVIDPKMTQLVVILKDGDAGAVQRLFDSFFGIPRTDTPDRDALTNNPLAIPGL